MARYIHCEKCHKQMERLAKQFDELYESVKGVAIKEMKCDGCEVERKINIGEECYAAILLPSEHHPNYKDQKPENWAHQFIKTYPQPTP